MHTGHMAAVDPDDDDIRRYVVRRYVYDPTRHERRHQVVAAFDNKREFLRSIKSLSADLQRRRDAGESGDPREDFTGVTLEPGDRRRQQAGRLLGQAMRHGATLSDAFLDQLELPQGMLLVRQVPGRSNQVHTARPRRRRLPGLS